MSFSFAQARELKPEQVNPFSNLISKSLQNYSQGVQAGYMPRQLEADIFHKTISPLAMLASSPFFSALNPAQQQQIGAYISQMLSNSPVGIGGNMSNNNVLAFGNNTGGQGSSQPGYNGDYNGNSQENSTNTGLVPDVPSEHFTQPFGETGYNAGTVHRNKSGQVISTPTGSQVERQQGILSGTTKVGKLYDDYTKLATEVADAGAIRSDISALAGGIGKLPFDLAKTVSRALGGNELAQKNAKLEDLKAKMRPALKEAGLNDSDINFILSNRGGESGAALAERLNTTRQYINTLTSQSKNILGGGFNVSNKQPAIGNETTKNSIRNAIKAAKPLPTNEAPPGSIALYRNNELYFIPQDQVDEALKAGFKYE